MGWYLETGATWMGRKLSSQEVNEMPIRALVGVSSNEDIKSAYTVTRQVGRTSCMRTNSASWAGVASEIVSGSMNVDSGETRFHEVHKRFLQSNCML